MDPASSIQGPRMSNGPNEFGYCPRTPASSPVSNGPQISPETYGFRRSLSSSPSRKRSRFFDTFRLKSPRNENIADENQSPKSLTKRKSVANLFQFASIRSRRALDSDNVHDSVDIKRAKKTSVLQETSTTRLDRRKSFGDIWGTISNKVSPIRGVISRHPLVKTEHHVDTDKLGPAACMSGAIGPVSPQRPIQINKQAYNEASTRSRVRREDSGMDVDSRQPQTPRNPSISSSMLWYEESTRTSTPVARPACKTPDSYLNLLIRGYCNTPESKTPDSYLKELVEADRFGLDSPTRATPVSQPSLFPQEYSSPFWGDSTQVEDEQDENVEDGDSTPPSYTLDESTKVDLEQVERCEDSEFERFEVSCVRDALPRVTVREVDPSDEGESSSIDQDLEQRQVESREASQFESSESTYVRANLPTVTISAVDPSGEYESLNVSPGLKDVRLGQIKPREVPQFEHSEFSWVRDKLLRLPNRQDSLENSPNIDPEFHLRGGDRGRRYQKLMKTPESLQHSTNGIARSIELTVAKMTKNYHKATSSEESLGSASTMVGDFYMPNASEESLECPCVMKSTDDYNFEMDQMEVWDSIIMGSRTLQQAKPFQLLKSIPSNEGLRHQNTPVGRLLQESTELGKRHKRRSTESTLHELDLASEALPSLDSDKLQKTHLSSKRRREASPTMIRVEFPKTVNLGAHTEIYESKSKAIAALYEYKLSELSNFCTYDPSTHTIFAHALESSVPNPAVLKQAGLDVLWLPMQKEIAQLIQKNEKTQNTTDLSLTEEKILEVTQEHPSSDMSRASLNLDTLSAHHDRMLAANLYNIDRRRSQFESEAKFIDPNLQSPSSSLQLDPASPQWEEAALIVDDDFFLEFDPDVVRGFMGSQYSEASRSSSPNGNHLSPTDLFEIDLPKEQLWSRDKNDKVKPVKTWVDLGREYLAQHPPQNVQGAEEVSNPTDADSEYSTASDPISSRKSSWMGPSTEHIEDISIFEKCQSLRSFDGQRGLSSILADESNIKRPKKKHCRAWSTSPLCAPKRSINPHEDMLDLGAMSDRMPDIPTMDSIKDLKFLGEKNTPGCEISEIPFPTEAIRDSFSPQSSISYTSYIEAERARGRMYQTSPLVMPFLVDVDAEDWEPVAEIHLEPMSSTESEKCHAETIDSKTRILDNTRPQLENQYGQDFSKKTSTESEDSDKLIDYRRSSCLSPASGFRFTEYSKQLACESNPAKTETESEESGELIECRRSSGISLASGFKFTNYSRQMAIEEGRDEDEEIPNYSASESSTAATGRLCPVEILDSNITIPSDDLSGGKEDSSELGYRKNAEERGFAELAAANIRESDLPHFLDDPNGACRLSWQDTLDVLNIRVVGKAARQDSPAKQEGKKVGALVDIFQAHGLMQSMKPALHRKQLPLPLLHQPGGRPATPTARLVTPSGGVYHPSGPVCVTAERPLSKSTIKRVPTPRSHMVRPGSGLSSVDTDVSELFGECLEKVEKHLEADHECRPSKEI